MTRDPLDDLGRQHTSRVSGQLFSDLASPPVDSELAGQQAALSMFLRRAGRAGGGRAGRGGAGWCSRPVPRRQPQTRVLGTATGKPTRRPPGSRPRPLSTRPADARPVKKARIGGRLVGVRDVRRPRGRIRGGRLRGRAPGSAAAGGVPDPRLRRRSRRAGQPPPVHAHPAATSHAVDNHSPATSPSPSLPSPASPRPSHHKSRSRSRQAPKLALAVAAPKLTGPSDRTRPDRDRGDPAGDHRRPERPDHRRR